MINTSGTSDNSGACFLEMQTKVNELILLMMPGTGLIDLTCLNGVGR